MKFISVIVVAAALTGCGTPQQQAEREAAMYEDLYGPRCVALGYTKGTTAYADCKLKLSTTK